MNKKTPIQAVIFDFDGTLADTRGSIIQCFWEVLNHFNISIPQHFSMETLFTHTLEEGFQTIPGVSRDMIPDAVDHYNRRYAEIARRKARLFPGVLKTLNLLKQSSIPLAIATNERRENLDELTAALNIESFFHLTVCCDEVHLPKPSPGVARRIIKKLDVPSEKTLVVGDSILDIEMGKTSGCYTCAVTYGAQSENTLSSRSPQWMVSSFVDILDIVAPARNYRDSRSGSRIVTI
jgi:phosphoglycolate phosphatase